MRTLKLIIIEAHFISILSYLVSLNIMFQKEQFSCLFFKDEQLLKNTTFSIITKKLY